jgi:hypothetical protein
MNTWTGASSLFVFIVFIFCFFCVENAQLFALRGDCLWEPAQRENRATVDLQVCQLDEDPSRIDVDVEPSRIVDFTDGLAIHLSACCR